MTITRLFFYATFVTCMASASVALAYAGAEDAPATSTSTHASGAAATLKGASQARAHASQVAAKDEKNVAGAKSALPATKGSYRLPHPSRQLDSYQNAVTPPPATNER